MDPSIIGLGFGTLAGATGAYLYLNNHRMLPAPVQEGKVLCDFHAHPTYKSPIGKIVETLEEPGLVGLTVKDIDGSGKDILRYEQALDILPSGSFTEISKGQLSKCGSGYFVRTQEIQVGKHHLLALGWKRDNYFPNYETIDEAVTEIRGRKGIVILNHPFALVVGPNVRLPKSQEEEELIRKAFQAVDEVETHNAHCINLMPYLLDLRKANEKAEALRQQEFPHFRGTSGSDCHRRWEQVKITGIYIKQSSIEQKGIEGIKEDIIRGNFTRVGDAINGPYVNRKSFIKGMLGDMLSLF